MEQTITINVPEGKKAVYNESTKTIEFVDTEPIRSKSWEEFCKNHPDCTGEYYISSSGTIHKLVTGWNRSIQECHSNNLKTKEDAEGILALIQLTRLHDEWVGDWKPTNRWYSVCVYNNEIVVEDWIASQYLLSFPTEKLALEFLRCFRDLIIKARRFI